MGTDAAALARLAAAVPPGVREVCTVLRAAGFEAVTVGGAVRDALLGREPGDWDVASSAHPDEVTRLFARTIPTGIQHGTVTVLVGRGDAREAIEVTTYRGEGAYHDGRRPHAVVFGVPLVEDLARRDLVVNAIAYDPVGGDLIDPFDGAGDLAARRLRAVGDPIERFTEDGLRVMRAIRFAATLGFALDADTEAAIPAALPSLAKVSRERVKVELDKLLAAPAPGHALDIARRTGVLAQDVPEAIAGIAGDGGEEAWRLRCAWIDRAAASERLAVLFSGLSDGGWAAASDPRAFARGDDEAGRAADAVMRRLKAANDERDRVVRLVRVAWAGRGAIAEVAVRRLLANLGRAHGDAAVAMWRSRGDGDAVADTASRILGRGDALAGGDLAVTGAIVMEALGLPPGREIGRLLQVALDAVLDDPSLNQRDRLLDLLRGLRS